MASGEFDFIERIRKGQGSLPEGFEGIGDDAAVIPMDGQNSMVITTDALIENVHFRLDWASAYEIGRKSAAVNISDVAAMGASALGLFLSLAVPSGTSDVWMDDFVRGLCSWNVPLLGGDTSSSPDGIAVTVTAIGKTGNSQLKRRSTAKAGDSLYVTGNLGDSAAGLYVLQHSLTGYEELVRAHLDPVPKTAEGEKLGRCQYVTAMMDISDGLAGDALHIAKTSGLSVCIDCNLIPMSKAMLQLCAEYNLDPLQMALGGGEDYQLLFATEGKNSLPLHAVKVGRVIEGDSGISFENSPTGKQYGGYKHF